MFDFVDAIILGIIEGITEFLPISSTGHLIIANEWFGFEENFTGMFNIVIQTGAILAVVVFFFERIWIFGEKRKEARKLWQKILIGVLPAIFFGFLLGEIIEEKLFNPIVVAVALFLGGIVLIFLEKKERKIKFDSLSNLGYRAVFFIGLFQCLAMIPGVSRSAATIIGAMALGASRIVAVEFSFFLAIPTMVAASGYSLLKNGLTMNSQEIAILSVGFVSSFFVAWIVIAFFMKYIQTKNFIPFGYYRIILGILVLGYFLLK